MLSGSDPVLLNQTASKLVDEMSRLKEIRAPRGYFALQPGEPSTDAELSEADVKGREQAELQPAPERLPALA